MLGEPSGGGRTARQPFWTACLIVGVTPRISRGVRARLLGLPGWLSRIAWSRPVHCYWLPASLDLLFKGTHCTRRRVSRTSTKSPVGGSRARPADLFGRRFSSTAHANGRTAARPDSRAPRLQPTPGRSVLGCSLWQILGGGCLRISTTQTAWPPSRRRDREKHVDGRQREKRNQQVIQAIDAPNEANNDGDRDRGYQKPAAARSKAVEQRTPSCFIEPVPGGKDPEVQVLLLGFSQIDLIEEFTGRHEQGDHDCDGGPHEREPLAKAVGRWAPSRALPTAIASVSSVARILPVPSKLCTRPIWKSASAMSSACWSRATPRRVIQNHRGRSRRRIGWMWGAQTSSARSLKYHSTTRLAGIIAVKRYSRSSLGGNSVICVTGVSDHGWKASAREPKSGREAYEDVFGGGGGRCFDCFPVRGLGRLCVARPHFPGASDSPLGRPLGTRATGSTRARSGGCGARPEGGFFLELNDAFLPVSDSTRTPKIERQGP